MILNPLRHTDRASGLLTAVKHVRDVVNYWMTEGPRNSHTTNQIVVLSTPGREQQNRNWDLTTKYSENIL